MRATTEQDEEERFEDTVSGFTTRLPMSRR